ncbi:MAG: hypothetical protein LBQ61_05605 [Spirochaetales bacterium]|jgi:hypothetical protein|nr:hypothetical protein [Spirochaetales bacterium]
MTSKSLGAGGLILGLLLFGCRNNPPEILSLSWQLWLSPPLAAESPAPGETPGNSRSPAPVAPTVELSVFLLIRDEDGEDDGAYLYLSDPKEELFWEIPAAEWEKVTLDGESWIGYSAFRLPPGADFYGRSLELILVDRSGQQARRDFRVSVRPPDPRTLVFPRVEDRGDSLRFINAGEETLVRLFDSQGKLLDEFITGREELPREVFFEKVPPQGGGLGMVVSVRDPERGYWRRGERQTLER